MDEIVKMEHVYQYNEMMGQETLHPLVSVIDFSKCPKARHARRMYGFYCVFLKDVKCGDMRYGRHYYDYQEGTLVFITPGQVVGIEDNGEVFQPKGWALLFHPDLIRGTSLGRSMDEYTFFSYEANEALHLSEQERLVVLECLQNITGELNHAIDKHSRRLIVSNIELLLNYSIRFYERQFITRSEVNKDALSRFERLLNDYFKGDTPQRDGVPSVRWCAEQLHLSANCFGDYVSRGGLDAKVRELLTFSMLLTLGGCEPQLRGHIQGNLNVGNDKRTLLTVITQLLPYVGYPRSLNAIACLNEVAPGNE